jgi:hypothetical protein
LLVWIEAECRHRQAMKEIAKDGLVIYSAEGEPCLSPYNTLLNATARTLLGGRARFLAGQPAAHSDLGRAAAG